MSLPRQSFSTSRSANKDVPHVLGRLMALGRPLVMGVLNVTPDSFSDGVRFLEPERAIEQARRMVADGADIVDIEDPKADVGMYAPGDISDIIYGVRQAEGSRSIRTSRAFGCSASSTGTSGCCTA